MTVKPLSETRWESRIDALEPLRHYIEQVYDALFEATTDAKIDAFGKNTAIGIAKKLTDFRFLCCLVTWYDILYKVNLVSKLLLKQDINLQSSLKLIESVKTFLSNMRSETGLNGVITDAKELAEKIDVSPEFPDEVVVRARKIKRQFFYECQDEPVKSGEESFKVNFFFVVLDTTISSLSERFEQLQNHGKHFQFLYNLKQLEECGNKDTIKEKCRNLQSVLTAGDNSDISGEELMKEIFILSPMLPEDSCPKTKLSYLMKNGIVDIFPNVFVALRILLTLPISVASGERSFSKLKLIKNYLRSSTSQERLNGLATLAIESRVLNTIDTDKILRDFAKQKARKVSF